MRVAVVGLGIIGSRAHARLCAVPGLDLACWNRSPKGVTGEVASLEEAAPDESILLLYLKDAPAVRETVESLVSSDRSRLTLLNHSTIDLPTTQWLAETCAARGWRFLDAPFTGSRDAAAAGGLVYYVGGPDALIDEFEPLLLHTGKEVIRCGEAGHATILKLVTNLVSACTVQALSEALATATRHGISPAAFTAAVASNACGSPLAAMKLPTMAAGNFETHFSLENMLKDSRYVRSLAAEAGLDTPAITAVSERLAELCESGRGSLDYSALAAPYLKS